MATSGNWGQFWNLSKLDCVIRGAAETQPAKIYGNSRNMVQAIITVDIRDKNGKDLNVTDEEVGELLYFCQSETGENLDSSWLISKQPNEYLNETGTSAEIADTESIRHIRMYISSSRHERDEFTEQISVGINIPGFGKFDTSRYGTSTKAGSGSVFKSPQAFEITVLRPIDYGVHDNISIEYGDFDMVDSAMEWQNGLLGFEGLNIKLTSKENRNATCKRRYVYIRPKQSASGQQKFKNYAFKYNPIYNSDVSSTTDKLYFSVVDQELFHTNYNNYTTPCAVMGSGPVSAGYEVNIWFPCQNLVAMSGVFYLKDSSLFYKFNEEGKSIEKNYSDGDNGGACVVLYKMTVPVGNTHQLNWHDVVNDVNVEVTDFNGNRGEFKLMFNDSDKFDKPGLV